MTAHRIHRVAVTGIGLIDPFGGDSSEDFFARLMRGESAVTRREFPMTPPHASFSLPVVQCERFSAETELGKSIASMADRYSQLGIAAALRAWQDAGFVRRQPVAEDAGVSWGTGIAGIQTIDKGYTDFYERGKPRPSPLSVVFSMHNAAASHIAIALGLGGACQTHSVACASSAVSIGEAFRRIRHGESTLVVAGGSEAPLTSAMMRTWEAMRVLAPDGPDGPDSACRPFHAGRAGFVLG